MNKETADTRPLGPAPWPAPPPHSKLAKLSPARREVYLWLRSQDDPVTIAKAAKAFGLHDNTARLHLDGLVDAGLAVRGTASTGMRGRPAWTYIAEPDADLTSADGGDPVTRDYAGLATALAGHIARTSDDPQGDARRAGQEWGRSLADSAAPPAEKGAFPVATRRRVIALLDDLGFAPESARNDVAVARLTRCPLLDTAKRYPDVVCQVHLGIVEGALDVFGADPDGTDLEAFAEPGACVLRFGATRRR